MTKLQIQAWIARNNGRFPFLEGAKILRYWRSIESFTKVTVIA